MNGLLAVVVAALGMPALTGVALLYGATEMPEHATRLSPPPGLEQSALKVGDRGPDFKLPATVGGTFVLSEALHHGPVVLVFYRGSW